MKTFNREEVFESVNRSNQRFETYTEKERKEFVKKPIPAPEWLKEQMRKLRDLPPPTPDQVERQFRASAEQSLPQWLKKRKTSVGKDSEVK